MNAKKRSRGTILKQLLGQAESVIKLIEDMDTPYPLKPVLGFWPDLPSGARPSPERLKTMEEERALYAIREPLTRFLLDTKRNVNDSGTPDQKQRFQENGLVRVAFEGGHAQRSRYVKADCLEDLRSLKALLKRIGATGGLREPRIQAGRVPLAVKLQSARASAGQTQEQAADEIQIDVKAYNQYERGARVPRSGNLSRLMNYIKKHS